MSPTPPEASTEYSRGVGPESGASMHRSREVPGARPGLISTAVLAGGVLGALVLVVSEFTTLYSVYVSSSVMPVSSQTTGSHNSYALVPIAVLAAVFAVAFWRYGSRPALLGVGALGLIALLIALIGDLPDAHASGLVGSPTSHYQQASASPSAGLYLETLGAVLLIISCGCGVLLLGPRRPRPS